MPRLFIGLWPPDDVRDAVLRHAERWSWPRGARRVRPDKVHMTLHFLGQVAPERVAALTAALAVPCEPFALRLDHGELWPRGIAAVCASETPAALLALHAGLRDALGRFGIATEARPYRAHLTVARQAQGAVPPQGRDDIAWRVEGYSLIESDLRPPTQYRLLTTWRMQPGCNPGCTRAT